MQKISTDSIFVAKMVIDDDPADIFTTLTVIGGDHIGRIGIGDDLDDAKADLASKINCNASEIVVTKVMVEEVCLFGEA